ncbi:hypothetical protein ACIQU6_22830 [Streptomyces sp. NPDC090442]|uniref:hypothetical protein n=1 Tax=Streptomyces sp. NPDC090442 TaxID=3365962 RepID=UPI0038190D2F
MTLRTKTPSVRVDKSLRISYDPKKPHEVFVESQHPRIVGWSTHLTIVVIGVVLVSYALVR